MRHVILLVIGVIAGVIAQDLRPANPTDLVSAQHQVRQDMAIEELARLEEAHEAESSRRVDRLEKREDIMLGAMVGILLTQLYTVRKNSSRHDDVVQTIRGKR